MENDEMEAGTINWFAGISVSFPKTSGTVPFWGSLYIRGL